MTGATPPHQRWIVLSGLFLVYMASNGVTLHTLPLLYPELMDSFGWQATEVTLPATVFFVIGAITSPPAGWLLDRYSSRVIIAIGSMLLTLGLLAYSATNNLWQLVAVYALLGLALSLCGLVSNMVMLTGWFDSGRGRATGILLMASSLGGALFPLAVGSGIDQLGWRQTVLLTGVGVGSMMLGSAWLLLRDGRRVMPDSPLPGPSSDPEQRVIPRLLTRRFATIVFATGSLWFIIIALTQHQSIHLARDVGLARSSLPSVFSLFFGCSVVGKFCFGLLSDRFDLHRVMAIAILMLAIALIMLSQMTADATALLYGYAVLAGLGFSGAFTCIQILIAAHYSGPLYGRILATIVLIDTLCGALGTQTIASVREWQGDYTAAFIGMAALAALSAMMVLTLSRLTGHAAAPLEAAKAD
jgi:OFA family oxalate/formate antiporter-like MFS transporter